VGARPYQIAALIIGEAGFLTLLGAILGMALLYLLLIAGQPLAEALLGLYLPIGPPTLMELTLLGGVVLAGFIVGIIPAWRAYRNSLADGMSIRL
jgi:putative ABC transport system permease protein